MEFYNRVRVNYFFVPWIAGILLMLGLPSSVAPDKVQPILWCILMAPIVVLELKIFGQWFTKGKRSLGRTTNPSTYLSVIGNFMVAQLAMRVDWKEVAMFFFTMGLVHYVVVFVTLYERLSSDVTVSRKLSLMFFLFITAPTSASLTWQGISGSFDTVYSEIEFILRYDVEVFNDLVGMRISYDYNVCGYDQICRGS
ncbi:guard cell S-type anion channel SLAC1-like [Cryptomeria japonica]|uniref:guard cell S-type anion channel SLAC1-like n=1 Tax=Cryptomeria japonica TaxID=3369 RepID=UPI0025ABE9E0|nr:guard cell S-type anion channel SLAC1-like [Cryptomeria japonica]